MYTFIYKIITQVCCGLTSDTHSHAECVQAQRSFCIYMCVYEIKNVSESIKHTEGPTKMIAKTRIYI